MIDIAVVGIGNRAGKYLGCLSGRSDVRIKYLVEPDPLRLQRAGDLYAVQKENRFSTPYDFVTGASSVDGVIICSPDRSHYQIAVRCLERGWNVLLEKPAAVSYDECEDIVRIASERQLIAGVCLEMRYHTFYRRIKEIVDSGALGKIVSIAHTEFIGRDRMCHTFVRGLWSRAKESSPIFLAKCSHDADFVMWLTGGTAGRIDSMGSLTEYTLENAPSDAAERCVYCPLEAECAFSAVDLYRRRRDWTSGFDVPDGGTLEDTIETELIAGRYGRCVYKCDNDVYDRQSVSFVTSGGVAVNMYLDGVTDREGRYTEIEFTGGRLVADGFILRYGAALDAETVEDFSALALEPLHGGADKALLDDWIDSIRDHRPMESSLREALEGHRICIEAH